MATTVTWDHLRELAGFRADNGRAITLYVNLDPTIAPTAGDADTRINSLLDEGEKSEAARANQLSHAEREALKADFDRIRHYLKEEFDRDGAHGVAVFAAGLHGVWRPLQLPAPVADEVCVGDEFAVAALLPVVGRGTGAVVAAVSRERGGIYRLADGRLEEVVDRSEEQPGQHDQGGWSQARYQRRIDNLAHEHFRRVGDELNRLVRRKAASQIVVVCNEEMRSEFAGELAQETQTAIVGWTTAEAHAGPSELLEAAEPVLEQARERQESELVERWREEVARNGRAASGWAQTLEAASDARVELLLVQQGAQARAWQCPQCARAAAAEGSCPLDGSALEPRDDAVDVAVRRTLVHGGSVCLLRSRQDLQPVEGIGALLRF